jgi:hypothetical protein
MSSVNGRDPSPMLVRSELKLTHRSAEVSGKRRSVAVQAFKLQLELNTAPESLSQANRRQRLLQ